MQFSTLGLAARRFPLPVSRMVLLELWWRLKLPGLYSGSGELGTGNGFSFL